MTELAARWDAHGIDTAALPLVGVCVTAVICATHRCRARAPRDGPLAHMPASPIEHVLHAENQVICEEATALACDALAYRQSLPPASSRADICACALVAVLHVLQGMSTPHAWHAIWGVYAVYAACVCAYAECVHRPMIAAKLALALPYTAAVFLHAYAAWVHGTAARLDAIHMACAAVAVLALLLRRTTSPMPANSACLDRASAEHARPSDALPPPSAHASLLGRLTYLYLTPFLWRQYFAATTFASVPQLPLQFRAAVIVAHVRLATRAVRTSLLYRLWLVLGSSITLQLSLAFMRACFRVVPITCLSQLLKFMMQRDDARAQGLPLPPMHVGIGWALCLFGAQITEFLLDIHVLQNGRDQSIELRSYLSTELFSKILRRRVLGTESAESSAHMTVGHMASLVSVDMFKIDALLAFLHQPTVDYPFTILFCCMYLFYLLGPAALVGLSVLLITAPLQTQLSKLMVRVQDGILQATDARLDLANEVLMCIKTVKFFAWERPFLDRLRASRARELTMLAWNNAMSVVYNLIFVGMPMIVTLATFGTYTRVFGHALTPQTAFTALSIFTTLRMPLSDYPEMIVSTLAAMVSVRRIDKFLRADDSDKFEQLNASNETPAPAECLGFRNASFAYDPSQARAFRLTNLSCAFPVGALSIVLGPVGSGKTSLLLALLGELHRLEGTTMMPCPIARSMMRPDPSTGLTESAAYCSQNPWLLGTTVRENILFGSAYDEARYQAVLRACALEQDLNVLEHHDETEVGEKGTALSGGQKARIALARAFYSRAKHVLVDDALSAVDAHTGEHLYRECFHGPLAQGRTIVLVTHAAPLALSRASFAVVMQHGRISAQGTPQELVKAGSITASLQQPSPDQAPPGDAAEAGAPETMRAEVSARRTRKNKRAHAESIQRQVRGWDLYLMYCRSAAVHASMAVGLWMLLLAMYVGVRTSDVMSNAWLKQWANAYEVQPGFLGYMLDVLRSASEAPAPGEDHTQYYMTRYALLVVLFILTSTLRDCLQYYISLRVSRLLYARLLTSLLYARPRFFDITPIGRIMNRLSKDVETVDQEMTPSMRMMIEAMVTLAAILGIICWATPKFLYMAGFVMVMYYAIGALYLGSSRDLKRIESVERSPLFTLLGETLIGTVTIRAFGDGERVIRRCMHIVDRTHRAFLYMWYENRWLTMCVDLVGAMVTLTTAILLVLTGADAALTGFTLAYAVLIVQTVLRIVRRYTATEINLNSVERIHEYVHVPSEKQDGTQPPAHWPTDSGLIRVQNLTVRYSPELPHVLKNVSFNVKPGEKVGIVGRTGSGKSTLSLAFFRFLEAESGSIFIDDIDIATITLESLRRRLTIIPQDSQLLRGTIRSNLDPFGLTDDADMWFALQRCQLVKPGPDAHTPGPGSVIHALDDPVEQGGSNFSAGQRQLLSLARGMLKMRESRILILDESTANLDTESDALIQRTIREQMAPGATILTVAHRLHTIIDYDKVLVLDQGCVLEYDRPSTLLADPRSTFYMLCERTGDLAKLKAAAAEALATSTP